MGASLLDSWNTLCHTHLHVLVQVAFFQLIALPMYITFQLAFPACRPMVETLMANYQDWVDQENSYKQQQTPAQTKT